MIKTGFITLFTFIALITVSIPTSQAAPDNSSLFKQGQQAFRAGELNRALTLFKQAETNGLKKASLYYNMGVCNYSLKQYNQAKEDFENVIALNKDMAPLAYYNLGLIAMRQNQRSEMIAAFETAMTTTTDSKVRDLAATALEKNGVSAKPQKKPYQGYVEVSIGYDDNIELYSDLLGAQGDGDWYTELYSAGTLDINGGSNREGSQLFASVYYQKYTDYSEYDLGTADVGMRYTYNVGDWRLRPAVEYAYTVQDMKSYDQTPTFSFKARHPFYWDTTVRLSYRLSYIDILDSDYDAIEGTRNKLRAEIIKKWKKTRVSLKYTLELNDRDSDDLSPTRHTFAVKVRQQFTTAFSTTAIIAYRNSSYDNTTDIDRDEDRWKTTLRARYQLDPLWSISADYTYSDNEDNPEYDRYNYTRNVGALRLERSF